MFTLPHNTIAVLYKQPMDMRLGMFRLHSLISVYKEHSLTKGAFYLFTNRPRTLLKAVWFDGTGICLFSKRLEKGQFSWPTQAIPNEEAWMQIHPLRACSFAGRNRTKKRYEKSVIQSAIWKRKTQLLEKR